MSIYTLNIDIDNKKLLPAKSGGSYTLPAFSLGDTVQLRLAFLRQNSGVFNYIDYSADSLKVGIGATAATPSEGEFKLTWNGVTSSAISYNATTSQVQTALASAVSTSVTGISGVTVGWMITMTTAGIFTGTTAGLGGSAFTLYPQSSVLIDTDRLASAGIQMRQAVRLLQQPAAFNDSWDNSQVTGGATLTQAQAGSGSQSAIYSLDISNDVYSGQYTLIFGDQAVGLPYSSTADQIQTELSKLSGIGTYLDVNSVTRSNVNVDGANGQYGITFVGNLSNTNITSAFIINDAALVRPPFKTGVVTLNTSALNNLLRKDPNQDLYLEVEISTNGNKNIVYRGTTDIDSTQIINTGSVVPAQTAQYYTKSEIDSGFIANSASNVNSTARSLNDSSSITSLNYGSRTLNNNSGTQVVSYGTGIAFANTPMGFFGSSVTAKPSGTNIVSGLTNLGLLSYTQPTAVNVVSGLINTGLIASGVSYGVLPQSPYTVTTLASVTFGTLAANDQHYRDVVVTGALVNDIVLVGLPTAISAGAIIQGVVYKTNTVCLSCVNADSVSRDVNTATYRITVIGY
jgi:hypothetical protein